MLSFFAAQALVSLVLLLAAVVACAFLRRSSASHRHFVWSTTFSSLLAIPILAMLVPPPSVSPSTSVTAGTTTAEVTVLSQAPAHPAIPWKIVAGGVWAVGTLLLLLGVAVGLAICAYRRRRALPFRIAGMDPLPADVRISTAVSVPETFGLWRPVILLPAQARHWTADRLQIALLHEFVHIKRRDWAIYLTARIAASLFWFNPLCWYALARLRQESELACDDGVLYAGVRQSDYAHQLIEIAKSLHTSPNALVVPMARPSQIEDRIRAILNPERNRRRLTVKDRLFTLVPAALVILAASLATAPAQIGNASLSGTVRDPSKAVVPQAAVFLANAKGQETVRTDEVGRFEFTGVPDGKYSLKVLSPGFKAFEKSDIQVTASSPAQLEVMLDIGRISETLQVVAQGRPQRAVAVASPGPPVRIRVGGNMKPARLITRVQPQYPSHLAAQGIEASILLEAVIGTSGQVVAAQARNWKADPEFVKAAVDAVKQWRYEPTLLNGVAVEVVATITVDFKLNP